MAGEEVQKVRCRAGLLSYRAQVPGTTKSRQERVDQGRGLPEGAGQRDRTNGRRLRGTFQETVEDEVAGSALRSVFRHCFEQVGFESRVAGITGCDQVKHLDRAQTAAKILPHTLEQGRLGRV